MQTIQQRRAEYAAVCSEALTAARGPVVVPAARRHHWSVYLIFASFSLLVAGLASDPRFHQIVREWLLRR
ncbi:MAG: hypothetical protein N2652_01225 [Kiritimatiellae bacterium]|nr:hypothetical protein [Kiritimatiellia bacterium]